MPKVTAEMTALQVGRLKTPGDYRVGGVPGLMLRIRAAGISRSWVLRVSVDGGVRSVGLGAYPEVSLALAREKAREIRLKIGSGEAVILTKSQVRKLKLQEAASAVLFKDSALAMIAAKRVEWSNPKSEPQWRNTLETYAYPKLGHVPVPDIDVSLVLEVLEPIWYTKPETASRVRGRIEAVIDYACVKHQIRMDNPARWKGHLDVLLPEKGKVREVRHHRAVPWKDARDAAMRILRSEGLAAKALMFTLLTAVRSGSSVGVRDDEIDWDHAIWTVPENRMKGLKGRRKVHKVPLPYQALVILKSVTPVNGLYFYSAQTKGEFSDGAMCAVMDRLGIDATTHGWRSTFRDWGAESTGYANEVLEMALAHVVKNKAEAAYRRGDMLERRRPLMQEWADYVMPLPTIVMPPA